MIRFIVNKLCWPVQAFLDFLRQQRNKRLMMCYALGLGDPQNNGQQTQRT